MTWKQFRARIEPALKEMERVKPLAEVEDYHKASVAIAQSVYKFAGEQDQDAFVNPFLFLLEPSILALGMAASEAEEKLPVSVRQVMTKHGCFDGDEKPTSLTTFALQEPITIEASALEELWGEPPLSGKVVLAVVATSRVTSTEDMACGSGLMQAKGVFLAVHYTVTNDANSRIQPSTQINSGLALVDGRGRRWTGNSARGHCFLEAQLAAQRGGDGPESWVEAGFTGQTAVVFDIPRDASGLRLHSEALGLEVILRE